MMNISQSTLNSPLQKLDGRTKLIALMVIFILALVFSNPFVVVGLLALVLITWWIEIGRAHV